MPLRQRLFGQADSPELDSAMGLLSGDLSLDGGTRTEGHRKKLADESRPGVDAVQPRLIGQRNVILRITDEVLNPRQAADRTHFARTDLQSSGFAASNDSHIASRW